MRLRSLLAPSVASLFLFPAATIAQDEMAHEADHAAMIENALSAAPASVAANATVADFEGNVLREGSNGYTCLPDDPSRPGNSPMCLDAEWMGWANAWMNETQPPERDAIGFAYMLQGDFPTSNIDPYATEMTADNEWTEDSGPHIMIIVPDASMLDGITTDRNSGGPWVMWRDTPYVHIMVPAAMND